LRAVQHLPGAIKITRPDLAQLSRQVLHNLRHPPE
jgi:hypothetical protein